MRRVEEMRNSYDSSIILEANKAVFKDAGNKEGAAILKKIQNEDNLLQITSKLKEPSVVKMSPTKALNLLLDANLTKSMYVKMQTSVKECGINLIPPYEKVFTFKNTYKVSKSMSLLCKLEFSNIFSLEN